MGRCLTSTDLTGHLTGHLIGNLTEDLTVFLTGKFDWKVTI